MDRSSPLDTSQPGLINSQVVHVLKIAIGRIKARSMNRYWFDQTCVSINGYNTVLTWKSPRFEADVYKKLTLVN